MGFRFYKRVSFPGGSLNLSKSGASLSVGCRGAHVTFGNNGSVRTTVGIPGTGIFYTDKMGRHTGVHSGPPITFAKAMDVIAHADHETLVAVREQREAERAAKWASLTPNQRLAARIIMVIIAVLFGIALVQALFGTPRHDLTGRWHGGVDTDTRLSALTPAFLGWVSRCRSIEDDK